MPSPITQTIGSAVAANGGLNTAISSARDASGSAASSQVAQTIRGASEQSATNATEDKRRAVRTPTRVEGSYSPQSVKAKKPKDRKDSSSEQGTNLDRVA